MIERNTEQNDKTRIIFDNAINTDDVAASVQFVRTRPVQPPLNGKERKQLIKDISFNEDGNVYAFDTSLKLMFGGVRINQDGSEDHLCLSSKSYHHRTGHYKIYGVTHKKYRYYNWKATSSMDDSTV